MWPRIKSALIIWPATIYLLFITAPHLTTCTAMAIGAAVQLLYQQPCPSLRVLNLAWRLNENYHYLFLTDHLSSLNMLDDLTLLFFPALFKCEPLACRRRYVPDEAVCVCSPPRSASVDLLCHQKRARGALTMCLPFCSHTDVCSVTPGSFSASGSVCFCAGRS